MTAQSQPPPAPRREELEAKLRAVDQKLREELIARGFDPDQEENLALTAPLAKLYMERENLRAALNEFDEDESEQ